MRQAIRQKLGNELAVARQWGHVLSGMDQKYVIGGQPIVLPPRHQLPRYQRHHPLYDSYFRPIILSLANNYDTVSVLDIGANVGDTAVALLTCAPNVRVTSVEGDPVFLKYLKQNTEQFGDRFTAVPAFVGSGIEELTFVRQASTGGFQNSKPTSGQGTSASPPSVTTRHLLDIVDSPVSIGQSNLTIFKSDTDGLDLQILIETWHEIIAKCKVLWFEYDPKLTIGGHHDIATIQQLIDQSGWMLHVFDNAGRHMISAPHPSSGEVLGALTRWLEIQQESSVSVPYLDLWLSSPENDDIVQKSLGRERVASTGGF